MKNKEFLQQKKDSQQIRRLPAIQKKTEDHQASCPFLSFWGAFDCPLVELPRFELRITEPKSAVLPLHHSSIVARKR